MMNQDNRSTGLIGTQKDKQEPSQSVQLNATLLRYIKPTMIGLSIATLVLGAGLATALYKQHTTAQQNAELKQKITDLENFNSAEVNAKLTELKKSEKAVLELQNYLQERGAYTTPPRKGEELGKPNDAAGGPVALKVSAPVPFMGSYAQNTQNLLAALKATPMGAPVPTEITSTFGGRANPFSGAGAERHSGMDFHGEIGDPVHATATGVVNFAGRQNGYGNIVRISLASGYEIMFAHLSKVDVKAGEMINAGDIVGKVGSTGRSTGPHLHYEIRKDGLPIDPEPFLTVSTQ